MVRAETLAALGFERYAVERTDSGLDTLCPTWAQEVGGSNPLAPIKFKGVAAASIEELPERAAGIVKLRFFGYSAERVG